MWTIGNKTNDKVYYSLYRKTDDSYRAFYDGRGDFIEANSAIEIDIDLDVLKIGFSTEKPFLGIAVKWVASPVEVKSDRPVTLGSDKIVRQPDDVEFTDPKHVATVNFFNEMAINNAARSAVSALAGKIPTVGGVVSGVIEFVWPEQKPDLIKESEERMRAWVRGQIESYDTTVLRTTLDGLRKNLRSYAESGGQKERMQRYISTVDAFDRVQPTFLKKPYTRGTIDLIGAIGALHIALLREQVVHPRDIFGDEAVNMSAFKKRLKETIREYQEYIEKVALAEELKWRDEQIERDPHKGRSNYPVAFYLRDKVAKQIHYFAYTGRTNLKQGPPEVCVNYYVGQAKNSYEMELRANVVDPSKLWSLFDPDLEKTQPIPMDRVLWSGPYAGLSFVGGNEHDFNFGDVSADATGQIREIFVREHDKIDLLQFKYTGHDGAAVGNPNGGTAHTVTVKPGTFLTRIETWWDFDLFGIKFGFSDGSSSEKFGNRRNGGKFHQIVAYPGHYISSVKIGKRLHELQVGFTPLPNYYDFKRQS